MKLCHLIKKNFIGIMLFSTINAYATPLAQQPLFLTEGTEPNVMFIMDDSSSMWAELMPEKYQISPTDAAYVFPWADVYSDSALSGHVITQNSNHVYHRLGRSRVNTIYYDPSIRYRPWKKMDLSGDMPDADPACAFHNPVKHDGNYWTGTGAVNCRNLTQNVTSNTLRRTRPNGTAEDVTGRNCTGSDGVKATGCSTGSTGASYYPATYWYFSGNINNNSNTGDGIWNINNYTKVEIRSTTPTYSGHGRTKEKRTDCIAYASSSSSSSSSSESANSSTPVTCTYDEEIKNFANWYTYYRSRILLARAAISAAFAEQDQSLRVGYGAINKGSTEVDGINTTTIVHGVRKFDDAEKTKFLKELYKGKVPYGGSTVGYTPLRRALDDAGKYYSRTGNAGPWGRVPGDDDPSPHLTCRASTAILMTDGYWNNHTSGGAVGNTDGTGGPTITDDNGNSYTYSAVLPFRDSHSNTLADVAMKYWKTDLRTDLANRVTAGTVDPAFWQHMRTYTIGLGVDGTIEYPFRNGSNYWTVKDVIEDPSRLPAGFAWPSPGGENDSDPRKIDDLLHAAINGRGDYFSAKDPDSFKQSLIDMLKGIKDSTRNNASAAAANSTSLNEESAVYYASFNSEDWTGLLRARRLNPGGDFGEELWVSSIPSTRKLFTYNNGSGVILNWDNLTASQQTALRDGGTVDAGQARLQWFMGDESVAGPTYDIRSRAAVNGTVNLLGDIVNSDPAFAGRQNSFYNMLDNSLGGGETYITYYNDHKKNRREVVYVGSNGGYLHGFDATTDPSDSVVDGSEIFAYAPSSVFGKIRNLSKTSYGEVSNAHFYLVDGPVYVSDAYVDIDGDAAYEPKWRNLLVGSLGAGGKGIFVLDVTDPDNFSASNILFELTEADYPQLGNITGMPVIAMASDGRWKVYVGNGYNSTHSGAEKAFLGVIDITDEYNRVRGTATSRTKFIQAGPDVGNALAQPALFRNAGGKITLAYAGDLKGNLWKFDLTSANPSDWGLAYADKPLFIAKDSAGVVQPITSSPTLGFNTLKTPASLMVYFGTGKYVSTEDVSDTQVQTFYAVADRSDATHPMQRTDTSFHAKSFNLITVDGGQNRREILNQTIEWSTKDGWYLDFGQGERVITKPYFVDDRLIFTTLIPSTDACHAGGSGWLMELKALGQNPNYSILGERGNISMDVAVIGRMSPVFGSLGLPPATNSSSSTSTSASASSTFIDGAGCAKPSRVALYLNTVNTVEEQVDAKGEIKNCDVGRQSWRQLQ